MQLKHKAIEAPEMFFEDYYHVFYRLARDFISEIPFYPDESVLDIGCRNGKVTKMLALLNTDIEFTAVTTSKNFLECIQQDVTFMQLPNVQLVPQLLDNYFPSKQFDKVISFVCLNWQQDKQKILKIIFEALKPGKKAYLQLFVDHGQDWFDQCIFNVANLPQWKNCFQKFTKKYEPVKPGILLAQAEQVGFVIEKSILQNKKIPIKDEQYFANWMMTWGSHLHYLPHDKINDFFAQAVENYLQHHPKDKYGKIYYEDFFFEVNLLKPRT